MKKNLLVVLVALGFLTGCAHRYTITLNNHYQITATSKPRLDRGYYYFKDGQGKDTCIPAGRVTEIAPASQVKESPAPFKPQTR